MIVLRRTANQRDRARHNDFDAACRFWWGDRTPRPPAIGFRARPLLGAVLRKLRPVGPGNEHASDAHARNVDFGGSPTRLRERRCVVCRPFTEDEALELITPASPELPHNGTTLPCPPGRQGHRVRTGGLVRLHRTSEGPHLRALTRPSGSADTSSDLARGVVRNDLASSDIIVENSARAVRDASRGRDLR